MRRLLTFLSLTFGFSWSLWGLAIAFGGDTATPAVYALYIAAAFGPNVVAWLLALTGRPGTRQARLRATPRWLPAALLLGTAAAVGASALAPLAGAPALNLDVFSDQAVDAGGWLPYLGLALVTGPIAEEFGWRGYAQPLLRRRFSARVTPFVLGPVWAVWHVPLFLLTGTSQHAMGLFSVQALGLFLVLILQSVGLLVVSERLQGGVPAAMLLHLVFNMSIVLVPLDSFAAALMYVGFHVLIASALVGFALRPRTAPRTERSTFGEVRSP